MFILYRSLLLSLYKLLLTHMRAVQQAGSRQRRESRGGPFSGLNSWLYTFSSEKRKMKFDLKHLVKSGIMKYSGVTLTQSERTGHLCYVLFNMLYYPVYNV